MISKNDLKKNTIRGLLSAIKNKEIDNRDKNFDEFMLFEVFSKLVKQRQDSIKEFLKNERGELVDKEKQEMQLIQGYMDSLPVSTSEEIDIKAVEYLEKLKASQPELQMKQVFNKIDWNTMPAAWKASPNAIKSSIAAHYKKFFWN